MAPRTLSPTASVPRETLAALRRSVRALEGGARAGALSLGPGLAQALPQGGLALGALHEVAPQAHFDGPAALGFILGAAARALCARPGELIWIRARAPEFGAPYGPGLAGLGLEAARLLFVRPRRAQEALWAAEEAARTAGLAAVVAELGEEAADLVAARRLQLAAESAGGLVLLLRPRGASPAAPARTRLEIAARVSRPAAWSAGKAPGAPTFRARIARVRGGRLGTLDLEWRDAAHGFDLAAPLADAAADARSGAPGLAAARA